MTESASFDTGHFPFATTRFPHYTIQHFAHYCCFSYQIFNVGYHFHVLVKEHTKILCVFANLSITDMGSYKPYFPTRTMAFVFSRAICSCFSLNHQETSATEVVARSPKSSGLFSYTN